MISPTYVLITKYDIALVLTVSIVSGIVTNRLFTDDWVNITIATLFGVTLHGLLVNRVSKKVNAKLNIKQDGIRLSVYDFFRFSTIFVIQRIITSYTQGLDVIFDSVWLMTSGFTILGYSIFNVIDDVSDFEQYLIRRYNINLNYMQLISDLIKITTGAVFATYFVNKKITVENINNWVGVLVGFSFFHILIKPNIIDKASIKNEIIKTFN